jgi:hypothetical protein
MQKIRRTFILFLNRLLSVASVEVRKLKSNDQLPYDFTPFETDIISKVRPFTMTSPERIATIVHSVRYVTRNKIPGDFVECGVWKGGSAMAAGLTFLDAKADSRSLWLYDTYEGMSQPTDSDESYEGQSAEKLLDSESIDDPSSVWCRAEFEEVKENVLSIGYSEKSIHFVKGRVEETIPRVMPDEISILRLDTDWYESTKHELKHLYPRLRPGGVLIIDDYGYWKGSRKAVDEYFADEIAPPMLIRIDSSCRIAIKPNCISD